MFTQRSRAASDVYKRQTTRVWAQFGLAGSSLVHDLKILYAIHTKESKKHVVWSFLLKKLVTGLKKLSDI